MLTFTVNANDRSYKLANLPKNKQYTMYTVCAMTSIHLILLLLLTNKINPSIHISASNYAPFYQHTIKIKRSATFTIYIHIEIPLKILKIVSTPPPCGYETRHLVAWRLDISHSKVSQIQSFYHTNNGRFYDWYKL